MNKIEVTVLDSHKNPAGMMMFLAKLTQRGHQIQCMDDLMWLYNSCMSGEEFNTAADVALMPHGTIKRFTPITVAIVGASRRFLAQARTHQVGMNFVSASLQYSDYSDKARFVVPYPILAAGGLALNTYDKSCDSSMDAYKELIQACGIDNDSAGYVAPQGMRNILIMQGNHDSWRYFIRTRGCNRNTVETQYVTMRIWHELLHTVDGSQMFYHAGPDCCYGTCREGKMTCGKSLQPLAQKARTLAIPLSLLIISRKWPLLGGDLVC